MNFNSTKAIFLYFSIGLILAILFIVLRAPFGAFLCLLLPFFTTGLALIARRTKKTRNKDTQAPHI